MTLIKSKKLSRAKPNIRARCFMFRQGIIFHVILFDQRMHNAKHYVISIIFTAMASQLLSNLPIRQLRVYIRQLDNNTTIISLC